MSSSNSTITVPDNHWVDAINLIAATSVAAAAYGIMFTLYIICCYFLTLRMGQKHERRLSTILICYITTMFVFGTIYVVAKTRATMVAYVYFATSPEGPANYNNLVICSAPVGIVSNISYIISNWMADAMQLWRLFILFQGLGTSRAIITVAFPFLIYLGSLAMGLLCIVQVSLPNGTLWANGEVDFALPYFVLSVSMSIIATGLMLWRNLSITQTLKCVLGKQATNTYVHICAILVESCALNAVFSLIFIVLFAISHPIQYVFLSAMASVQIIAPLLIIFRISQGKAWNRATTEPTLTNIQFKSAQEAVNHQQEKAYIASIDTTASNTGFFPDESM